jgi:pathogenesis-related protein 1
LPVTRLAAGLVVSVLAWAGCEAAGAGPADGSAIDTQAIDLQAIDRSVAETVPVGPTPDASRPPPDVRVDTATADARPPDAPPGADPEPAGLAGMTRLHNQLRAQVSVAGLAWDPALASIAQAYAEGCRYQHSGRAGVGENLAANAPPGNTAAQAFQTWADEKAFYTYASNSCASGKECGHYTQVVWRNSTRLGCGVASCTTGSPFTGFPRWELWVCNYGPPGNFNGERPY